MLTLSGNISDQIKIKAEEMNEFPAILLKIKKTLGKFKIPFH